MTANHPIYSTTQGAWRPAGELLPGERLLSLNGETALASKAKLPGTHTVYNLEVRGLHNFLVGKEGVVVHNSCWDVVDNLIEKHPVLKSLGISRRYPGRGVDFDQTIAKVKQVCDKFGKVAICFDDLGFPDFSGFVPIIDGIPAYVEISDLDGSGSDFDKANQYLSQKLGLTTTKIFQGTNGYDFYDKDGIQYSWHHHQDGKTMILVPYEIHRRVAHIGGADILKKLGEDGKGLFPSFEDIHQFLTKCL